MTEFTGYEETGYQVTHYILAGLYFLLAIVAFVVWVHSIVMKEKIAEV
jgi:hypothetical protein